jgi:hypothetical protein
VCLQEDHIFPDGRQASSNLRILEMAHMWRNQMKRKRKRDDDEEEEAGCEFWSEGL